MMRSKSFVAMLALVPCLMAGVAFAQAPGMGQPKREPGLKTIRQDMINQMAADEARLDELVAAMNAAQGSAKVDAIAAVVNELVSQRRAMRAQRDQMRAAQGGGRPGGGKGGGKGGAQGQGNAQGAGKAGQPPKGAAGAETPAP